MHEAGSKTPIRDIANDERRLGKTILPMGMLDQSPEASKACPKVPLRSADMLSTLW